MNDLGLSEEDIIMLESLVRSPAFGALKRCLDVYRKDCMSVILTSPDLYKIHQTQGRIIGLNAIESLPHLLIQRREAKLKKEASKKIPYEKRVKKKEPEFKPSTN